MSLYNEAGVEKFPFLATPAMPGTVEKGAVPASDGPAAFPDRLVRDQGPDVRVADQRAPGPILVTGAIDITTSIDLTES